LEEGSERDAVCDSERNRLPEVITAFKTSIASSGLRRLLQSTLGEWGEAVTAAMACATDFAGLGVVPKLNAIV